jgi:hypothetical protein
VRNLNLDVKDDKSLWMKQELEGVGSVLLVEESYYDGIVEMLEDKNQKIKGGKQALKRELELSSKLKNALEHIKKIAYSHLSTNSSIEQQEIVRIITTAEEVLK